MASATAPLSPPRHPGIEGLTSGLSRRGACRGEASLGRCPLALGREGVELDLQSLGTRECGIDRGTLFSESFFGGGLGGTGLVKVLLGVGPVRRGGSGGGSRISEVFFGGGLLTLGTLDGCAGRLDRQRDRLRASLGGRGGLDGAGLDQSGLGGVLAIASGSEGSDKLGERLGLRLRGGVGLLDLV